MRAKKQELQKIAEGLEAEMFAWEEGTILRLLRDPDAERRNEWQAAAMEAARSSGVRVPAVYGMTTAMGRPGLIMERIEGPDLLTLVGRRPWQVFRVARVTGEVHAQLHAVTAPESVPALRSSMRQAIESSSRVPRELGEFALEVLDGLPDGDRLCHGDFHPGNILMAGETPVLIDWTNARRGEASADVARTILMVRRGELPPGTPVMVRPIALVGRSVLTSAYLRAYRRLRSLDMDLVARWQVPVAAARLVEGIDEETPGLLALLEKQRRSSG